MAFNKAADREGAPMKRRPMHRRKKVCVFCGKIATVRALWCFAQLPVILRGRIFPLSEMYLFNLFVSL